MSRRRGKNSSSSNIVSVRVSDRFSLTVSYYNDGPWFHLKDIRREKSVSLNKSDIAKLFKKKADIVQAARKVVAKEEKKKTRKNKKKPSKVTEPATSDDESMDGASSDSEGHEESDD